MFRFILDRSQAWINNSTLHSYKHQLVTHQDLSVAEKNLYSNHSIIVLLITCECLLQECVTELLHDFSTRVTSSHTAESDRA